MSPKITYKTLFTQVIDQINKRIVYRGTDKYEKQLGRASISPIVSSAIGDIKIAELVQAIQEHLQEALPAFILDGLTVSATDPISSQVTISSGTGSVGGTVYYLEDDTTITIPFDTSTEVFYINLFKDRILIDKNEDSTKLKLAKIIVPNPGTTNRIKDHKDDDYPWDAYIVMFQEQKLYGDAEGRLEEDSIEVLRDNIGDILADNLIGNIRLNEDLKIINTAGTLELNSDSLKLYDNNENQIAKFNKDGVFFYDVIGRILAKFGIDEAYLGNILITKNSIQSRDYSSGSTGFKIGDDGNVEFNDATLRGILYASGGEIGGFTITDTKLYGGIIQTGEDVGAGENGVKMDSDGLHVYDAVLGRVVYLPSDGSAPEFSSGTITETTFEISTQAAIRTASTVGDGSSSSAGILINNTGIYGTEANQLLQNANLKALIDGTVRLKGEIIAEIGSIGSVTITSTKLSGGLIEGAIIRGGIFESSSTVPRIRIDSEGIYYQETTNVGKYGESGSGLSGFQYGDGTKYGTGVLAYLFNTLYPPLSIVTEQTMADLRLYNRTNDPVAGTHQIGDLIVNSGILKICSTGGTPGTFSKIFREGSECDGLIIENRTSDPGSPVTGQIWFRTDV